jgi:peptidyl-prolyl cis-trans isomerase B (cyclophilin B)
MIQGGGLTENLQEKPTGEPIANEARNKLRNKAGTIAMARTEEVDSARAQFFINTEDNRDLDHGGLNPAVFGYAVFGQVVDGMEVVWEIERQPTTTRDGYENLPVEAVIIRQVTLID